MKELLKYNIKLGILLRWKRIIIIFIIFGLVCFIQYKNAVAIAEFIDYKMPSVGNIIIDWLSGISELPKVTSIKESYNVELPKEWAIFIFGYILYLLGYIRTDLSVNGYRIFLRSGKKTVWWSSKCIWVILSTLIYFIILYLVIFLAALLYGNTSIFPVSEIWSGGIVTENTVESFFAIYIMPIIAMTIFGMILVTIEMILSTIIAAIAGVGYLFAGVFWNNPLLITNQTMYLRMGYFNSNGSDIWISLCVCMIIGIVCYITGRKYIKRYEWTREE